MMRKLWFSGGNVLAVRGQVWTPRLPAVSVCYQMRVLGKYVVLLMCGLLFLGADAWLLVQQPVAEKSEVLTFD